MTLERAIADYDAVRVRRLPDWALVTTISQHSPEGPDGDWWRACVHELARRHPVILTPAEMIAEHQGR